MVNLTKAYSGKSICCFEDLNTEKEAVQKALYSGISLEGVALDGVDLSNLEGNRANFNNAHLTNTNFTNAYLPQASFKGAFLQGARFIRVNLLGARFNGANLTGADFSLSALGNVSFRGAYLNGVDLRHTSLVGYSGGADFTETAIGGVQLYHTEGANKYLFNDLHMMFDQRDPIRAYKLVSENRRGVFVPQLTYELGKVVKVNLWDTDPNHECGAGINLATLSWCMRQWSPGNHILVCEFNKDDVVAVPVAGGKFRVKRCKVVGEKSPQQLGLPFNSRAKTKETA